mgnify:CR=1 FL=1
MAEKTGWIQVYLGIPVGFRISMYSAITDWLLRWGQTISGIGSVLLAAMLAYLYWQQKKLLANSFSATHRAVLEVDSTHFDDENLLLRLSNVGNGVALAPELVVIGVYTDSDGDVYDALTTVRMDRMDRGDPPRGGSINAKEEEIEYSARLALPSMHGGARTEFESCIQELVRHEVIVARVFTLIRYSDLTGEYRGLYVKGWEFDPEEIESINDLQANAGIMVYGEPTVDIESLDYDISDTPTSKERTII